MSENRKSTPYLSNPKAEKSLSQRFKEMPRDKSRNGQSLITSFRKPSKRMKNFFDKKKS